MNEYDYIIVGAGIVGAAVADELCRQVPSAKVLLLEKEPRSAAHQTGRNSGVIHAGVYYPPNSLKARYCAQGAKDTYALCESYSLPVDQCGKIIVATSEQECERLETLYQRCEQGGLSPERLTQQQLRQQEPNITGMAAFKVKQSGITDYAIITDCLLSRAKAAGKLEIRYQCQVTSLEENQHSVNVGYQVGTQNITAKARFLLCCAGVYSDALIRLQGLQCDFRIIPFKGEYFRLPKEFNGISQHLIYPVPDPDMPFLGVHLTKMIGGFCTVGPNAVMGTGRETYSGIAMNLKEWQHVFGYKGTWSLLWKYKSAAFDELYSSLSKYRYAKRVKRYCPAVDAAKFLPFRTGIRAQAVDESGNLIHDFKFVKSVNSLHVGNAPSPAATSAMPIARAIVNEILD